MAAELQTVSAAFDVARLAWSACVFLNKIRKASDIAREAHDRLARLKEVLDDIRAVLEQRERSGLVALGSEDSQSNDRIDCCIQASSAILHEVETKLGGFGQNASQANVLQRVKVVLGEPRIQKLQFDLEARISALNTDLSLLHVLDQAHTHAAIGSNHKEMLETLHDLRKQVDRGNDFLERMHLEQHSSSIDMSDNCQDQTGRPRLTADEEQESHDQAIRSLKICLRNAEDLHERYTSEYVPDDRSIRFKRNATSHHDDGSPFAIGTPVSEPGTVPARTSFESPTHSPQHRDAEDADESDEDAWPLDTLNSFIRGHIKRAQDELLILHFNQAENALQAAIKYSELKERAYGVEFEDRATLQEEVATCYLKQGKYGEAVSRVRQLLCQSQDEDARARQHQLLATIYYDRHVRPGGRALSHLISDIENAEKHARKAYGKRFVLLKEADQPVDELERYAACTALLIRILKALDQTVEATELSKMLYDTYDTSSNTSDSIRRVSTIKSTSETATPEDKHVALIEAICRSDVDKIYQLLNEGDVDINGLTPQGLTPLMCAVEQSNVSLVRKLLDPGIGANVNCTNNRGLTALHLAAQRGKHEMVRCLLEHDAEKEMKDVRGETPLLKAVQSDQATVVQILSDSGADVTVKDHDEWSGLHFAVRSSKTTMIDLLLDLKPELMQAVDRASKTALHYCCELGLIDAAERLLVRARDQDVNAKASASRTPLRFAADKPPTTPERRQLVNLLLQHGAVFEPSNPPLRYREYAALKQYQPPRRNSRLTRHDSVSTDGSIGTVSTTVSRLSRMLGGRMQSMT